MLNASFTFSLAPRCQCTGCSEGCGEDETFWAASLHENSPAGAVHTCECVWVSHSCSCVLPPDVVWLCCVFLLPAMLCALVTRTLWCCGSSLQMVAFAERCKLNIARKIPVKQLNWDDYYYYYILLLTSVFIYLLLFIYTCGRLTDMCKYAQ